MSATLPLLATALAVGFVGSLHCVGMCGPFAVLAGQGGNRSGILSYSVGRLLTYATLGVAAGALGAALAELRIVGAIVSLVVVVVVALQLAGWLPEPRWAARVAAPLVRALSRGGGFMRLGLGAASALMPCGLVYAAMGVAVTAATPLAGAATMVAFGLGTWPALIAVGLGARSLQRLSPQLRAGAAVAVAAAGVWAIGHRGMVDAPADLEQGQPVPSCCAGAGR